MSLCQHSCLISLEILNNLSVNVLVCFPAGGDSSVCCTSSNSCSRGFQGSEVFGLMDALCSPLWQYLVLCELFSLVKTPDLQPGKCCRSVTFSPPVQFFHLAFLANHFFIFILDLCFFLEDMLIFLFPPWLVWGTNDQPCFQSVCAVYSSNVFVSQLIAGMQILLLHEKGHSLRQEAL